jgi:hypothetical protein
VSSPNDDAPLPPCPRSICARSDCFRDVVCVSHVDWWSGARSVSLDGCVLDVNESNLST